MSKFADIPRDVSWLSFNHRVLQEAADPRVPLFERIKFLAIYSSNLDEFFRVRVAALRSFKQLRKKTRRELDIKPKRTLKQVLKTVAIQLELFGDIWRNQLIPEMEASGLKLLSEEEVAASHSDFAVDWFKQFAKEQVEVICCEEEQVPFLQNKGLYFAFRIDGILSICNLPEKVDRFVVLPPDGDQQLVAWSDDLIRAALPSVVKGFEGPAYAVKISRDAEMYIEDEFDGNLVDKIRKGLSDREVGLPTRFLYQENMEESLIEELVKRFELTDADLVAGAPYHNFHDLFGFPDPLDNPDWHYAEQEPHIHSQFENADSYFDLIRERDQLLSFPYQSFSYVAKFLEEAAEDPAVELIKITFYRVASDSRVAKALIRAAENGKEVTAFLEIKARFDEASNLHWGAELERAGVRVIYSYAGIKVHTKLYVIGRKEESDLRYYAYLGTGNFNEKTARIYCDHALMSADPRLTTEALQVFEVLERKRIITKTKHLLVSPFSLRDGFEALIEAEADRASRGEQAWIIAKMNSLEDPGMIYALKKAAAAGVKIQLIIRGICCLDTEDESLNGNVTAVSLVGRYLEHARVYVFANGGSERMYIASADWMTRNLDRRIELAVPIYDSEVRKQMRQILDLQLADNTKARLLDSGQTNGYKASLGQDVEAQNASYDLLAAK